MEIFFAALQCFLIGFLTARIIAMSKKISSIEDKCESFQRKFLCLCDEQSEQFDDVRKTVLFLSEKINVISDIVKDDNDRSLQAILNRLDAAKPIKPNNWDSVREAFKGPVRIEIDE